MFLPFHTRVYLAVGSTDMRKSINGLSILVADEQKVDPLSGHLFVFWNRCRNMVKILYWDRNGFCLWHKRLEKHSFKWQQSKSDVCQIDHRQLSWLLESLEINQALAHKELEYSIIY